MSTKLILRKIYQIAFVIFTFSSIAIFTFFVVKKCSNDEKNIIKIGVIAPLTGNQSRNAEMMMNGFRIAAEEDGIVLVVEDSQDSPSKAKSAALKLITQDKVIAILGDSRSVVTKSIADETDTKNIILVSSISTSDNLTNNISFFRNVPRNELQAKSAYLFIKHNLQLNNVAIFNKNDDYGNDMSNHFKANASDLNIVFTESYANNRTDFKTSIEKIKLSGADVIFTPSNYEETKNFIKQAIELNLNIPIIGGDDTDENLINTAKQYSGGYYYTTFIIDENSDFCKSFYNKFKEKLSREPQTYEAYAYEAAKILFESIKESPSKRTEDVKFYLTNHVFENSLTGEIGFDNQGNVKNRIFGVIQVTPSGILKIKLHEE